MGSGVTPTMKLEADCTVTQFRLTEILPFVVPAGTVTVKLEVVLAVTVAGWLLKNVTKFSEGVVLKFVPVIFTVTPIGPMVGVKLVMV